MTTISLKPLPKILVSLAGGMTLLLPGLAAAPAAFAAAPELSVYINGPEQLAVGLSGTYNVSATNDGDVSAPAEVFIIFAGKLDQTDQVTASGLDCEVRHDAGINATVRCTTPQLQAKTGYNIVVHGRGSAPGAGQVVARINVDQSVKEGGFGNPATAYADNTFQKNVTIN